MAAINSRTTKTQAGITTFLADAALTRYRIACIGSDTRHIKLSSSAADIPLGVIVDGCAAAEDPAAIELFGKGESKIISMSGAGSQGDFVCDTADGSGQGRVLPAGAGSYLVFGRLLKDCLEDEDAAVACFVPRVVVVQAHMADVAAAAGACAGSTTPSATQVDTAIATAVAPLVTGINAILAKLETAFIVKASLFLVLFSLFAVAVAQKCASGHVDTAPMAQAAAVLPLACIPRFRKARRNRDGLNHVYLPPNILVRRYSGLSLAAGNEDAPAGGAAPEMVAANALKILDASGHEIPIASRDGAQIRIGNASAALGGTTSQQLSTFACGYPTDEIDELAQFLAPYVEAPIKFEYQKNPKANAMLAVEDDAIGVSGMPQLILPDAKTVGTGTLQWRGLETQLTDVEAQLAAAIPGGSLAMEEQDRIQMLVDATRRGRLLRIINLFATATGVADSKNWDETADPILDLRTEINAIAKECGGRQNVRVVFGADSWEILVNQIRIAGGSTMPRQVVDEARIAQLCGIAPSQIKVTYLQVVNSKQGKTTTSTGLLTAAEIYIYGCFQNPSRRDAGCAKTFAMKQAAGWYEVYTYLKHPKVTGYGINYYELPAITNSAAVNRLTITNT